MHFSAGWLVSLLICATVAAACGSTRGLGGARSVAIRESMRQIPAGAVSLGGSDGAWRRLELPAFAADRVAVSVRDYADFTATRRVETASVDSEGVDGSLLRAHAFDGADPPARYLAHPMVGVSHDEARAFCAWRGARLPTEAEWTRAVYGDDLRPYPWGDAPDATRTNAADFGAGDTAPLLTHPRGCGPFGVADGAGQVLEWTDTAGADGTWVVLGSSWRAPLRPRGASAPETRAAQTRSLTLGFRCVRDVRP